MSISHRIKNKIDELIGQAQAIAPSMRSITQTGNFGQMTDGNFDYEAFIVWNTRCLNLLSRIQGGRTIHLEKFLAQENRGRGAERKTRGYHSHSVEVFHKVAILNALLSDIKEGLLFDQELLITADALSDILDQAEHLLSQKYKDASAVLVGAVLESTLRKICEKYEIVFNPRDTINPLNEKLKDVAYNMLTYKQIIAWAELRNMAAHGDFDTYGVQEVRDMLGWVKEFAVQQLG
jgi:hypothetical protein